MTETLIQEKLESSVILKSISWSLFVKILEEIDQDRNTRLSYNEGFFEIIALGGVRERNNRFIESLICNLATELNYNLKTMGSLTLKKDAVKKAVEPDSCYYINNELLVRNKQNIDLNNDPPPDLVLEIYLDKYSLDKLPIYADLLIPEVWQYDLNTLNVYVLSEGKYNQVEQSLIFPQIDIKQIHRFVKESLNLGEMETLRQFRQWIKSQIGDE